MLNDYKKQRDVWVQYILSTGAVKKLYFSEPKENPAPNCEIFKTRLTDWAIMNTHLLVVQNGRVIHSPSLAGM